MLSVRYLGSGSGISTVSLFWPPLDFDIYTLGASASIFGAISFSMSSDLIDYFPCCLAKIEYNSMITETFCLRFAVVLDMFSYVTDVINFGLANMNIRVGCGILCLDFRLVIFYRAAYLFWMCFSLLLWFNFDFGFGLIFLMSLP